METDQQATYEVDAGSYFESISVLFEQTLNATKRDYPKLFVRLAWVSGFLGIAAIPFFSTHIVAYLFHTQSMNLLGKTFEIKDFAGEIFLWCAVIGTMLFGGIARIVSRDYEFKRATKPLPPRQMAFALSYAIKRELEHFERNKMELHQREIINLWGKLLMYLRWTLDSSLDFENTSFHQIPPSTYLVAPNALNIATSFNWEFTEQSAFRIIAGVNILHLQVTPILSKGSDSQVLIGIFRQLGNFLYTCIPENSRDKQKALWGYSELHRCLDVLRDLPAVAAAPQETSAERIKAFVVIWSGVFTHSHIVVAFFAWWVVFQALFAALIVTAFHYFQNLTMNSQAMVALIGGPIAAAISMVGVSRKFQ